MNAIFDILNRTAEIFEETATITKRDGTTQTVRLSPEAPQTETLEGEYQAAQNEIVFSASIEELSTGGATSYPQEGDVITGLFGALEEQKWKVTNDGTTGTAWQWKWARPGGRIIFKAQKVVGA